jgi:hypothetical protein
LSSKVIGFDHPLTHITNTQCQLKPHAVKGREGVKHHGNIFSLPAVNSDEAESDDDQNEIHICNQSNDMEFTEPLDVNFLNFNQTELLANNEIDLKEPLASHISFDQNWNSQLSAVSDCKLKTKGDIDMMLTENLPDICPGFQDHVKPHGKPEKSSEDFVDKVNMDNAGQEILMKVSSKCQVKDSETKNNYLIYSKTDTGILTQINNSGISFTEVVSCDQNKYGLTNTDKIFQSSPHCDTNVDGHDNSVINQSMDLTECLVQMKPLNNMEMFKPSVQRDNGYDRLQPTGRTCIYANDFSTTRPQGFTKPVDSIEKKMVNVSSLPTKNYIRNSGTAGSMYSDSECLHQVRKVSTRNTESTKPTRNVGHPAFTNQTYMHNVAENVQTFGLITLDGETYMNKMVDSSTIRTHVSDMELIDELKQKESDSAKASSQITDVGDMELTCSVNHKNIHIPFRNSARNSYMQITNGLRQNQISEPVQISSTAAAVSEMKFVSERQNQLSNLIDVSGLNCNATDMELTSGIKWKEICMPEEINMSVSDMELVNETRQNQISNPLVSFSHKSIVSDMELTSGMKWGETCNSGGINKFVSDLDLTNKTRSKGTANPAALSSHINTTDMELTSGIKCKETCSPGDINMCVKDMELTNETGQKETANPAALSRHISTTDMELMSGIKRNETCSPGDTKRFVQDMELTNETGQKKTANPAALSRHINTTDMELTSGIKCKETCSPGDMNRFIKDMELTNETRQKEIVNPAAFSSHINATDVELSEINQKGISNELLMVSECDSHAKTKIISAAETWKEEPSVPFSLSSNNDCINLSEQKQMGDAADVAHLLKSCTVSPVYNVRALCSNDLEEVAQHSEPTAYISVSGDRIRQSNYVEGETSLKQASSSKQTTVQEQIDSINYVPVSKVTHPTTGGRYNEETGSVLDAELNVETSVPAVSLNLNISVNAKELGKTSQKFDTKLSPLSGFGQESVNESIQNTANISSLLHDRQGSGNSITSSDKVSQGSHMSRMDNRVMKEDLSMQLLMEERTYTACTAETAKKSSAECDIVGNAESHCKQQFQYATKEKTCTPKNSTENIKILKSHNRNSFILQEESDGKQGHNTQQLTLNEYLEHSDLHVSMRTPLEPHGNEIMEQVNSAAPVRSRESGVMKENLDCTLASMPEEMELSLIKDLLHESSESYEKLVEDVRKADEIVRENMFMTSDECALFHNSQCAQQNSEERTLLHKLSNVANTTDEPVTMKEESSKHLELKTITEQEKSNVAQKCNSSIKQTDEQMVAKKLTNQNKDVAMSSLEEQIKAEELRLVIAKQYV